MIKYPKELINMNLDELDYTDVDQIKNIIRGLLDLFDISLTIIKDLQQDIKSQEKLIKTLNNKLKESENKNE